jgi:PIN domain nuclease of toxin-antitoxin system
LTVLDAYAVLAFLRDEPAAAEVRPLLEAGDALLTAVGLGEVLDHLVRLTGVDEEVAVLDLAELGLIDAVAVDAWTGAAS